MQTPVETIEKRDWVELPGQLIDLDASYSQIPLFESAERHGKLWTLDTLGIRRELHLADVEVLQYLSGEPMMLVWRMPLGQIWAQRISPGARIYTGWKPRERT